MSELRKSSTGDPVLIVETCVLFRSGIAEALQGRFQVPAGWSCGTFAEAESILERQVPGILVLGFASGGAAEFDTLDFVKRVRRVHPRLPILVVAEPNELDPLRRLLRLGVQGMLRRDTTPELLLQAAEEVRAGRMHVDAALSNAMLGYLLAREREPVADRRRLSDREAQVLDLYAHGLSTTRIGEKLGLAQRTVSSHLRAVQRKMGFRTARELLVNAVQWSVQAGNRNTAESARAAA